MPSRALSVNAVTSELELLEEVACPGILRLLSNFGIEDKEGRFVRKYKGPGAGQDYRTGGLLKSSGHGRENKNPDPQSSLMPAVSGINMSIAIGVNAFGCRAGVSPRYLGTELVASNLRETPVGLSPRAVPSIARSSRHHMYSKQQSLNVD